MFFFQVCWKKTHRKAAGFVEDNQLLGEVDHLDRLRQHRRLVPDGENVRRGKGKLFRVSCLTLSNTEFLRLILSSFPIGFYPVIIWGRNFEKGSRGLFNGFLEQFDVDHIILDGSAQVEMKHLKSNLWVLSHQKEF